MSVDLQIWVINQLNVKIRYQSSELITPFSKFNWSYKKFSTLHNEFSYINWFVTINSLIMYLLSNNHLQNKYFILKEYQSIKMLGLWIYLCLYILYQKRCTHIPGTRSFPPNCSCIDSTYWVKIMIKVYIPSALRILVGLNNIVLIIIILIVTN